MGAGKPTANGSARETVGTYEQMTLFLFLLY